MLRIANARAETRSQTTRRVACWSEVLAAAQVCVLLHATHGRCSHVSECVWESEL